jgi:hypothetical protein
LFEVICAHWCDSSRLADPVLVLDVVFPELAEGFAVFGQAGRDRASWTCRRSA